MQEAESRRIPFLSSAAVSDSGVSERISVRDAIATAAVDPHWLAALAWAVVGHAGRAPGRCSDFTALIFHVPAPLRALVGSLVGRHRYSPVTI